MTIVNAIPGQTVVPAPAAAALCQRILNLLPASTGLAVRAYWLLALVAYAALGGVIFLFVAFLQITLGYTALQAGAATLPITALMLILSRPSGAIAQRIGPRIPLAIGAVLTGAGLLLMAQFHVGDGYPTGVLPSLVVFGVGLAALITPITATVLASVGSQHSGIASAVNNAFPRLGQMIAVAALPLAAGLSGAAFETRSEWQPASRSR